MKAGLVGYVGLTALTTVALGMIPGDGALVAPVADPTFYTLGSALSYADMALDFVPIVGACKDLICLGLGINPITGEPVKEADTILLIGWMFLPTALRGAGKALVRYSNALLS